MKNDYGLLIKMSSHEARETVTVPVFIGASGKSTDIPESELYMKDYIVKQNLILQQDNKDLAEEKREVQNQIDDLEEQHDHLEKQYSKTKLYIKDFSHLNQIYRNLYQRDRDFFKDQISRRDNEQLIKSHSKLGQYFNTKTYLTSIYTLLTAVSCLMLPPLLALMTLLAFHYTFTLSYLNTNPELEAKIKHIDDQVVSLLRFHKEKDEEIRELTKTMDIISEFVDNAL